MSADLIYVFAETHPTTNYHALRRKVQVLTDDAIDNAVEAASGTWFEDMALAGETRQDYALRQLHEVYDSSTITVWDHIGQIRLRGTDYLFVAEMSNGDTPDGYDAISFLVEAGVLSAPQIEA